MSEQEILSKILQRLVRVETKIDGLASVERKVDETDDIAKDALASTKSAHRRLDKVDKVINWTATTIIGAVIIALLSLIFMTN